MKTLPSTAPAELYDLIRRAISINYSSCLDLGTCCLSALRGILSRLEEDASLWLDEEQLQAFYSAYLRNPAGGWSYEWFCKLVNMPVDEMHDRCVTITAKAWVRTLNYLHEREKVELQQHRHAA